MSFPLSENTNYAGWKSAIDLDQMEISISKEVLPSLEGYDLQETILGEARGSIKQYRNSAGLHVREYEDRFVIHRDKVDPRTDPIGHLLKDSPENVVSFGAALLHSKGRRSNNSMNQNYVNPFRFFLVFLFINRIIREIKKLF